MKADATQLLPFLKASDQFVIPIFQRTYSWTERECGQLWDDILRAGRYDDVKAHFVGSIVYIQEGLYHRTNRPRLLVIDGQQRLTTVMLLLEAMARRIAAGASVPDLSSRKIRNRCLVDPEEEGDRREKLVLTQTDEHSFSALMGQRPVDAAGSSVRVAENLGFLEEKILALGSDLEDLWNGLTKLVIVDISLQRGADEPQLIFESMNSMGRELSQADLIRNFILMGPGPTEQTRLYKEQWRPMEIAFGQEAYGRHFDGFMRHYLTLRSGEIPNIRAVYEAFKSYAKRPKVEKRGTDALVSDIKTYAHYYCAMALGQEQHPSLARAFRDLRELKVDVAYPFLLELYADYKAGTLTAADFVQVVRLIEAYVFRRAVCAIPTNSLNKTFATFTRGLDKTCYVESVQAHLLTMPTYRRFPSDEEFKQELSIRDLYNFPRRSYWLRRLENHGRKERVPVDEYTVEHILPQNESLSTEWKEALGAEWERVRDTWLHTLGNLTLTGYNAEYSDRPFSEKRDMPGGFRESPLRLNRGLGTVRHWNEDAIRERAKRLAREAVDAWRYPNLSAEVLASYRVTATRPVTYTIEHHQHLKENTKTRALFDSFRQAVVSMDPCVDEEVLKLYIAYKAETNFVDVVPQKSRLRLSLNMPFHELHDPRGLAKDVANVGRWGNGDVEVRLSHGQELAYTMGLVRQAFERQMGEPETGV